MEIIKYRYFLALFVFVILPLLTSCDFLKDEDPLQAELRKEKVVIDSLSATFWRGLKISYRSLPVTGNESNIDLKSLGENQDSELATGDVLGRFYFQIMNYFLRQDKDKQLELPEISTVDYIRLASDVYKVRGQVHSTDEDQYPTFLEVSTRINKVLKNEDVIISENWNSSIEHWFFALILEAKGLPGSFRAYELYKTDPTKLHEAHHQVMSALHKSLNAFRNEWFYLAELNATQGLDLANQPMKIEGELAEYFIQPEGMIQSEAVQLQLKSMLYALRGVARLKMETEKKTKSGLHDFENSLEGLQKLGMNNEITWMIQLYIALNTDDAERSIQAIDNLSNSPLIDDKEKSLLLDAKQALEKRDPESAFNMINDKITIVEIGGKYVSSRIKSEDWLSLYKGSGFHERISAHLPGLKNNLEKAKKYMELEEYKQKGKGLMDELR